MEEISTEVAPNIYLIKLPIPNNPLGFLNTYLVKTEEGSILLDTGWNAEEAYKTLLNQLEELKILQSELHYIVITHAHPDHIGLASRMAKNSGAKLIMHQKETTFAPPPCFIPAMKDLQGEALEWMRKNGVLVKNYPKLPVMNETAVEDTYKISAQLVQGGEHLKLGQFDFEVLWTPGHSPGHICLYEKKRQLLFSGDHLLPDITPSINMHHESENPLTDYLHALKQIANLKVKLVMPGHGDVFTNLSERVTKVIAHHHKRLQEISNALTRPKTAYEVASSISWNIGNSTWDDLSPFVQYMAVTETLAHLELLVDVGYLVKKIEEGIVWYIR